MNTHMLSIIKNISHLRIGDKSFPLGSPFIYSLDVRGGDYRLVMLGNERINEIQFINVEADDTIPEWIEVASNIFIRSGVLSIRASDESREPVDMCIGINRKCCGTIFCLEKNNKVIGIRITF